MSSDQLFLVEILVLRLKIDKNTPAAQDKYLQLCMADIFVLDVIIRQADICVGTDDLVYGNVGKSLLFPCPNKYLKQSLKENSLKVTYFVDEKEKGSGDVPWKTEFSDMVKFSENDDLVKSVATRTTTTLKDSSGNETAELELFIRMSCLGKSVQTPFNVIDNKEKKQEYLVKSMRGSRTFRFEFTSDKSCEIVPVGQLYENMGKKDDTNSKDASLKPLFDTPVSPKPSPYQPIDDFKDFIVHNGLSENDMISICFRPSENKFFDFLNMISTEVSTHDKGTYVTITKDKRFQGPVGDLGGQTPEKKSSRILKQINENVCKSRYCPASNKLKMYGLGPLKKSSGLGVPDKDIEVPITYGLSHLYGSLENYGPYALYSKPKNFNNDFGDLRQQSNISNNTANSYDNNNNNNDNRSTTSSEILRLKGGGEESTTPKSPLVECKSIIDQVDQILLNYKNSLGPCGKSTCPQAYNYRENICKTTCQDLTPNENDECCVVDNCNYKPISPQSKAGCQNPKCEYRKYKGGLRDPDAQLESSLLPPAVAGNCGYPKCEFPFEQELAPIHWDCPEPLPADTCKNPQCPYLPKDLKQLSSKKMVEPCKRNLECPYSMALACSHPLCPFTFQECPFQGNKSESSKEGSTCWYDSNCKSNKKTDETGSRNKLSTPDQHNNSQDEGMCDNPECPYANPTFQNGDQGDVQRAKSTEISKTSQGSKNVQSKNQAKDPKKKKRSRFVYSMGDNYPGVKVGHKECVTPVLNVPHSMGWLWNIHTPMLNLKRRRGWRPGAISKKIASRIKAYRQSKNLSMFRDPVFRKGGVRGDDAYASGIVPKPTLQLQKNQGIYWITMNPLKDPKTLAENENPYMDCTPMTLKITGTKSKEKLCYCDENEDPGEQSPDSDLDIEFTPPAAIINPDMFKRKKNVIHCDTQYSPEDFEKKGGKDKGGKGKKGGKGDKKGKKGGKGGKGGKKKK